MYMQQCAEFERYNVLLAESELSASLARSLSGFDEDDAVLVTPPVQNNVEQAILSTIMGLLNGGGDPVRQRKPVARKPAVRKPVVRKPVARKRVSNVGAGVGETCNICLEEMVVGDKRSVLKCKHVFHHKCLAKWMERSKTCPVDRMECGKVTVIKGDK